MLFIFSIPFVPSPTSCASLHDANEVFKLRQYQNRSAKFPHWRRIVLGTFRREKKRKKKDENSESREVARKAIEHTDNQYITETFVSRGKNSPFICTEEKKKKKKNLGVEPKIKILRVSGLYKPRGRGRSFAGVERRINHRGAALLERGNKQRRCRCCGNSVVKISYVSLRHE